MNKFVDFLRAVLKVIIEFSLKNSVNVGVSKDGLAFIKKHEGCKLEAYKCPAGVWTIGYGNTTINDRAVVEGDKITKEEAENMLIDYINKKIINVTNFSGYNQNQIDAYISFAFNCGSNTPQKARLESKDTNALLENWGKYNKIKNKANKGLTNRRAEEIALFNKA